MKNSKHTPGPWIQYNYKGDVHICKPAPTPGTIAVLGPASAERNAALISAAPEMYDLLHALWAKTDPSNPDSQRIAKILDAIDNKAKGGAE